MFKKKPMRKIKQYSSSNNDDLEDMSYGDQEEINKDPLSSKGATLPKTAFGSRVTGSETDRKLTSAGSSKLLFL